MEYIIKAIEEDLSKTHDGTSMGKIGPILDDWMENRYAMTCAGFDENGKKVYETRVSTPSAGPGLLEAEMGDEIKNIHCITNNTQGSIIKEGPSATIQTGDGVLLVPGEGQLKSLTKKNKDGDYMFRSFSLVSPDNTRMTVLRNDSFSKENHKAYNETIKDFHKQTKAYNTTFDKKVKDKVQNMLDNNDYPPEMEGKKVSELTDYARKEVLKEYGSWEEQVYNKGKFPERFEQCNTKFRIKHNK